MPTIQKPDVSKEAIHAFLHGSNNKQNVVKVETNSWTRFASVYTRKNKLSPKIIEKVEYQPFLWCKKLEKSDFYLWRTVGVKVEDFNEEHGKFVYNNSIHIVDEINICHLGYTPDEQFAIVSFKNNEEQREQLVREKMRQYGIVPKKLTTNYDGKIVQRLEDGYKFLMSIKPSDGTKHTNPLVSYSKKGKLKKITGTYQDLLDFFIDGGINPSERSGVFLDGKKIDEFKNNADIEDKLRLLLNFFDYPIPSILDNESDTDDESDVEESAPETYLPTIFFKLKEKELEFLRYCANLIEFQVDEVTSDIIFDLQQKNISETIIDVVAAFNGDIKDLPKHLNIFKKELPKNEKQLVVDIGKTISICKAKTKSFTTIKSQKTLEWIFNYGVNKFIDFLKKTDNPTTDNKLIDNINLKFDVDIIKEVVKSRYKFDIRRNFKQRRETCADVFDGVDSFIYKIGTNEQFMIQSGIRLFKGFNKFDDMLQLSFDIETQAQKGYEEDPIAALSPYKGRIFVIGVTDNVNGEKLFMSENDGEERKSVEDFFYYLGVINPDNIKGHNIEGFDFKMIVERYALLTNRFEIKNIKEKGNIVCRTVLDTEDTIKTLNLFFKKGLSSHYTEDGIAFSGFQRRESTLKVGGSTESVMQTTFQGMNVCDTMFSTKRQRATNKRIEGDGLKWNIKFNKLEKPNRVIIKGENNGIGATMDSKNDFYWNPTTGQYFEVDKKIVFTKEVFDESKIKTVAAKKYYLNEPNSLFLTDEKKDCDNNFVFETSVDGVPINDSNLSEYAWFIAKQFDVLFALRKQYTDIVIPQSGIGVDWKGEIQCWNHFRELLVQFTKSYNDLESLYDVNLNEYEKTTGKFLVHKYLSGDLEDPINLDDIYSQSSLQIAYWLPTTYQRTSTMGGASMWSLIMNTWSYLHDLAIPIADEPRKYLGALVGCFKTGYHGESTKLDLSSLYPSIFITHCLSPDVDISGFMKAILTYTLNTRLECKKMRLYYKSIGDKINEAIWEKKEIPLKLLNNTFYGWLAFLANLYNSYDTAEWITCTGRRLLCHIMTYFTERGMIALNCHTDGVLFQNGTIDKNYKYFGLGVENGGNWLVKPKEYTGIEAYVAEYNDQHMKGIMGLDIDDFYYAVALFAKGNYLTCKESKDKNTGGYYKTIDFTGGGVINKASSNIVTSFMIDNKNALTLMEGKGKDFALNFIDEQKKIIEFKANRNDIASTVKVGMTNEQYAEHLKKKNKAGNPMPRRVANELSLQYGLDFKVGQRIKYINNGKTKTDRDVDRDGNLSCVLLQDDTIDYNVEKYLEKFTNSVKNILLCYDSEVRKKIVFSKSNKNLEYDKESGLWGWIDGNFTENDFDLIYGQPKKESDEDSLEDLLLLNREEAFFWDKIGFSVDSFLGVR